MIKIKNKNIKLQIWDTVLVIKYSLKQRQKFKLNKK